jgi:hypothetical protein
MGQSLEFKSWGETDDAYTWVLHSSGTPLASGIRLSMGDGADTALFVGTETIGIYNAGGFRTELKSLATEDRVLNIANSAGLIYPETVLVLSGDVNSSGVSAVAVTDLNFTPEFGARYEFMLFGVIRSASTSVGAKVTVDTTGAIPSAMYWESRGPGASATTGKIEIGRVSPAEYNGADVPTSSVGWPVIITGMFTVNASGTTPGIRVFVQTETNATEIRLLAGSYIRFRRIS